MIVSELIEILEQQAPEHIACDWDNVGLLVGSKSQEVKKVYIALDATDEVIDDAIACGADFILTHHPMIFSGMKRVNEEDFIGRRVIKLIEHHIAYYAMHTNFDIRGMAELAEQKLGLTESICLEVCQTKTVGDNIVEEGIGRVGVLPYRMKIAELAEYTKQAFGVSNVKVFGNPDTEVSIAAVSPGSGKSEIDTAIAKGAEVLITGDIDHHDGIDSVAKGMAIIDAGHYGVEHIFIEYMRDYLQENVNGIDIEIAKYQEPFWIC